MVSFLIRIVFIWGRALAVRRPGYAGLIILVWFHIPALVRRIGNRFLIRFVWFVWLRQVRREIGQGHHATCQAEKQACGFNQILIRKPGRSHNDLNIADVHVGDKLTHDHFGLGTVIETQDKGMNSVITVDFGNGEVKRLLLRMAPIEML